jgi:hypothetical protein
MPRPLGHDAPAATSDGLGEPSAAVAPELGGEAAQECRTAALQVPFPITNRPSALHHASITEATSARPSPIDVPRSEERAQRTPEPVSRSLQPRRLHRRPAGARGQHQSSLLDDRQVGGETRWRPHLQGLRDRHEFWSAIPASAAFPPLPRRPDGRRAVPFPNN